MQTLSSAHKPKRRRIPISLTPLIDVVFILLVFFMLASSFQKTRSVELIPPTSNTASASPTEEQPVLILVAGKGKYKIDARSYDLAALQSIISTDREKTYLIKTGSNATVQEIISLLDLTGKLSLPKVSLLSFEETAE